VTGAAERPRTLESDPMVLELASRSAEDTEALGESLAASLEQGDLVTLSGPLGAGKTRFVEGLARGLGCRGRVRSPSFTLVNEYPGRILLLHLDLYRVEPNEVDGLGLDEELERAALVVEWGEKLPARFRADALAVAFEILPDSARALAARAGRGRGRALIEEWARRRTEAGS
jgi:tRNA threonylcarbamoyladenosine biosynthesis protein TsaE